MLNLLKKKLVMGDLQLVLKNNEFVDPNVVANLYKNIGTLAVQSKEVKSAVEKNTAFVRVTKKNMFHGNEQGKLPWHNSINNRTVGDDVVCMYMQKNDCKGGDTGFTDFQTAYQDLSDEQKKYWEYKQCLYGIYDFDGTTYEELTEKTKNSLYGNVFKDVKEAFHFKDAHGLSGTQNQTKYIDLVTRHPINNKKGFYFPWSIIKGFKGYDKPTGNDMIKKLVDYVHQDKYVYWHKWNLYDIVLSDQWHSLHKRSEYSGERELWRSGIKLN